MSFRRTYLWACPALMSTAPNGYMCPLTRRWWPKDSQRSETHLRRLEGVGFRVDPENSVCISLHSPAALRTAIQNGQARSLALGSIRKVMKGASKMEDTDQRDLHIRDEVNKIIRERADELREKRRSRSLIEVFSDEDVAAMQLTGEQQSTLDIACRGFNLYVGGNAGTGKSVLIRRIAHELSQKHGLKVGVTAMTGVAAIGINGHTLHHLLGIHEMDSKATTPSILRPEVLSALDVLIIDEISLMPASLLTALDAWAKQQRICGSPFGGLQVIVSGDFLQLPPPTETEEAPLFTMDVFRETFLPCFLQEQMRQVHDDDVSAASCRVTPNQFIDSLNELRLGKVTPEIFESAVVNEQREDALRIFPTKREAKLQNDRVMLSLPSQFERFPTFLEKGRSSIASKVVARFSFSVAEACVVRDGKPFKTWLRARLVKVLPPEHSTSVRITEADAAHVLRINVIVLDETVREFVTGALQELRNANIISDINSPTFTKSRTEIAHMSLQGHLAGKMVKKDCRVMLVRNISPRLVNGSIGTIVDFVPWDTDLLPADMRRRHLYADVLQKRFPRAFGKGSGRRFPLVRFEDPARGPIDVMIPYVTMTNPTQTSDELGEESVTLLVMPLVPAYGFTVHKIQGITLNHPVEMDCKRMWKCNHMIYVAASRVRRYNQLRLVNFHPTHVQVDEEAKDYMKSMEATNSAELADSGKFLPASWVANEKEDHAATQQ